MPSTGSSIGASTGKASVEPNAFGLRLKVDHLDPPAQNSKVRDIATRLENVLMSPDAARPSPGHWMMARQGAHPTPSRRPSIASVGDLPTTTSRIRDIWFSETPSVSVPNPSLERPGSPSRPNRNRHASQSLMELKEIYDDSSAAFAKILVTAVRKNQSLFRRRSTFSAHLLSTPIALSRIKGFWKKFRTLMGSSYTNETTPGSMLSSVLVILVEGRQTFLDLFNFGKSLGKTYKQIIKDQFVDLLLTTLQKLQKQRDSLLYFVGHRRAARATANGTMRRIGREISAEINQSSVMELTGSPIVNGPLLLLRDRLALCAGGDDIGTLFPEIHQIEGAVSTFCMQNYEEWTTLLFEADTIGTAVMDLAKDSFFRYQLYTTLTQVFVCARCNALSALSGEHSLSLVG